MREHYEIELQRLSQLAEETLAAHSDVASQITGELEQRQVSQVRRGRKGEAGGNGDRKGGKGEGYGKAGGQGG